MNKKLNDDRLAAALKTRCQYCLNVLRSKHTQEARCCSYCESDPARREDYRNKLSQLPGDFVAEIQGKKEDAEGS